MLLFVSEVVTDTRYLVVFGLDWAYSMLNLKNPPLFSNFTFPISYSTHSIIEQIFSAFFEYLDFCLRQ